VFYLASEEGTDRIAARGKRICANPKIKLLYVETLDSVFDTIERYKPDVFVLDSLNDVADESDLIEGLKYLCKLSERVGSTGVVISHVNKDGQIYGPNKLAHACDTHMHIKVWEDGLREVIGKKNRNHATGWYASFALTEDGCLFTEEHREGDEAGEEEPDEAGEEEPKS
jgi:predicted ATP-dependent serine protease